MWILNGKEFKEEDTKEFTGFVYCITNLVNNKKYIGKKTFTFSRTLKPLKGSKRKRKKIISSNWQDYYGSNKELLLDVEKYGKENFHREILKLCKTKGEASYFEAKYQFEKDVLLSEEYYNTWISVKVTNSHLSR